MGFLVGKAFQGGRDLIAKALPNALVESLAVIMSLDVGQIVFA